MFPTLQTRRQHDRNVKSKKIFTFPLFPKFTPSRHHHLIHTNRIHTHIPPQRCRPPNQPQPLRRDRPLLRPQLCHHRLRQPHHRPSRDNHPRRQRLLLNPLRPLHHHQPLPQLRRPPQQSPQNRPRILRRPRHIPHSRSPNLLPPNPHLRPLNASGQTPPAQPRPSSPLRRPRQSRLGLRCRQRSLRLLPLPPLQPFDSSLPQRARFAWFRLSPARHRRRSRRSLGHGSRQRRRQSPLRPAPRHVRCFVRQRHPRHGPESPGLA
jgi:hypothetical protein